MEIGRLEIKVREGEEVHVYALGDFHEGNVNSQHDAIDQAVTIIVKDPCPRKYFFSMGDMVDCILPSDHKRWEPVEVDEKYRLKDLKNLPRMQVKNILKHLEPIEGLCLGVLIGNHEHEYIRRNYNDIYSDEMKPFRNATKIGYVGMYRIILSLKDSMRFGFDFALNHGTSGGGKLLGYPANKARESFEWYYADFNIMGHLHQLIAEPATIIKLNHKASNIEERRTWYGVSGCFLKTYQVGHANYFEPKGRKASAIGMLLAKMSVKRTASSDDNYQRFTELSRIYL